MRFEEDEIRDKKSNFFFLKMLGPVNSDDLKILKSLDRLIFFFFFNFKTFEICLFAEFETAKKIWKSFS